MFSSTAMRSGGFGGQAITSCPYCEGGKCTIEHFMRTVYDHALQRAAEICKWRATAYEDSLDETSCNAAHTEAHECASEIEMKISD